MPKLPVDLDSKGEGWPQVIAAVQEYLDSLPHDLHFHIEYDEGWGLGGGPWRGLFNSGQGGVMNGSSTSEVGSPILDAGMVGWKVEELSSA